MSNLEKMKRGDKEIDEIKAEIEFCSMSPELKNDCIEKARDAMSKYFVLLCII